MIPMDRDLDEEITTVELRIHQRTLRVIAKGRGVGTALQRSLTSPAILLLAAGTGFAIGKITDGNGAPGQTRLSRVWSSIFQGVRAGLAMARAPAVVWLARLFGAQRLEQNRKAGAVPDDVRSPSAVQLPPASHL